MADLKNYDLPKNLDAIDKIKGILVHGSRIWWYYQEDKEFYEKLNESPRQFAPFSGVVVSKPHVSYSGPELDIENCVVVIDTDPSEKCYPEVAWVALNRLLDDENLIEIFSDI